MIDKKKIILKIHFILPQRIQIEIILLKSLR